MNNKKDPTKCFGNDKCKEIKEFICPHCYEHLIMNPRQYANHIRWCKCNPKYNEIKEKTTKHLKESNSKYYENKIGKIKDFDVICSTCGNHFIIQEHEYKFNPNKKYYCSRSCSNTRNHSLETKRKIQESLLKTIKQYKTYEYNNKLYRFKKECPYCHNIFYTDKENQICCCVSHAKCYRDLNASINCDKLSIYRNQCSFKFGISSYPEEFNFDLIRENGWYKAKNHGNNLHGVSRDHMYSVKEGFNNKIDPYLISHPANCKLLIHTENESKYNKCSITLEELKERIRIWNIKYGEYPNTINYDLLSKIGIEIARQPNY